MVKRMKWDDQVFMLGCLVGRLWVIVQEGR